MPRRPLLKRQPPGLEHIFNLLAEELTAWPGVRMRSMFGLRAFYRGERIFAMLPHKRSLERSNTFGYKVGSKWRLFEVDEAAQIGGAVERLAHAFEGRPEDAGL
jgi:hypothetical protein